MNRRCWAFVILPILAGCVSTGVTIPKAWRTVPRAAVIGAVSFDADGHVRTSTQLALPPLSDGPIRFVGAKIFNGDKQLTDAFSAVDSLDYSESRGEVAFSAIGERGFDIGLVSSDGSAIHWVPQDPADELAPQWAPRGNKISYVVRAPGGDLVRTVHIPTASQLTLSFPNARIHARAWDGEGQFFAVAYSTPDASDRVEVMKYGGEERSTAVAPSVRLDVEVEPFARGAILLRPRDIRYDEKLPVVIWSAPSTAWSDARGALMQKARIACVVATGHAPDLAQRIGETPWVDVRRVFVVDTDGRGSRVDGAFVIEADVRLPLGRGEKRNNGVAVSPVAIESFAAGFIAAQLKGTSSADGSNR